MTPQNRLWQTVSRLWGSLLLAVLLLCAPLAAFAASETVTLEDLHVIDVITLPTVRSARDITFTRPKTWQLSGSSYIYVEFQHSHELLPNRSYLQIAVNNRTVRQIHLTKENAKRTAIQVPLPTAILKDHNTLSFRVEQHYTDVCEDPLDKSLWTQIHPESKIVFDYTPTLPKVNLADFPYPIIDPLGYGSTSIRYIFPDKPTQDELYAASLVNVYFGQASGVKGLITDVGRAYYQSKSHEHLVYIGTPDDNVDIARLVQTHAPNQSLSSGLVILTTHPQFKNRGILVVTGNSDAAVLKAARFIASKPRPESLRGSVASVPNGWSPHRGGGKKVPRYIERDGRTFVQMRFSTQEVHKIYAPPIVYNVPVVTDLKPHNGKLFMDLVYSYSPKLNPLFSSLEIRLNDISIANIPLMKDEGETDQRAKIQLPTDILRTNNEIVAQFHLMPDKYGRGINSLLFGTSLQMVPINLGNYLPFFPPSVGGTTFTTPGMLGGMGAPLISPFQNMGNGLFASPFSNFGVGVNGFSGGFGGFNPLGGFSGFGVPLQTQPMGGFNPFGQSLNPFAGFGGIAVQQPQFGGGFFF